MKGKKEMNFLEQRGLTEDILDILSYKTSLSQNLKKTLRHFNKNEVLKEIESVYFWYQQFDILDELDLDYRIKAINSASLKWERYYPDGNFRTVFNDMLGIRILCDSYDEVFGIHLNKIHIADMTKGKSIDDGYRGVHIYFQKDNYHYPIEIQINTYYDRQFNNWMHDLFYKRGYDMKIGCYLRSMYECGKIKSKKNLKEELDYVLSCCKKI